jgi:Zn-dependent protease with chaperone function
VANFFVQQEQARTRSRRLVVAFHIVVLLTAVVTTAFYLFFMRLQGREYQEFENLYFREDTLIVFGAVYFMVWGVSLIRRSSLSQGGAIIAKLAGGTEVTHGLGGLAEKRLLNVVEEMSIAAGMPIPRVYILETEHSINAFAAGLTTHDACIAVSRGALDKLNRDELQGVVAHEFSHILNGDMRLNLHLLGYLYGLTSIADVGQYLMRHSSSRSSKRNAVPLFGFGIFIIGWVGYFFAAMLKAGVSRDRERLADASASQFTRNPEGIGGALRKIWRDTEQRIAAPRAGEISHFFFHWPQSLGGLFSTHPTLHERIKALGLKPEDADRQTHEAAASAPEAVSGFAPAIAPLPPLPEWDALCVGYVFYLWLEPSPGIGPIDAIKRHNPSLDEKTLLDIYQGIEGMDGETRFVLLEKTLQRLRQLPLNVKKVFLQQLKKLIEEDRLVTAREFLYYRLLQLELLPPRGKAKITPEKDLWPAVESVALFFGRMFSRKQDSAFVDVVLKQLGRTPTMATTQDLKGIQAALSALSAARPLQRPKIYDAFKEAFHLSHDKKAETQLALRLLALVLEVPTVRG